MKNKHSQFLEYESAVTAIEYALLASLITVVIAVTVGVVGTQVDGLFVFVKDKVVLAVTPASS